MLEIICSECASQLDINSYQIGATVEIRVGACDCLACRIEELESDAYDYSRDLDKTKTQIQELEEVNYNLSNEVELLKLKLYNIEHHLSH